MSTLIQTADHTTIQKWTEERQGQPAVLNASTNDNVIGVLRIKFPNNTADLKVISWNEFFSEFDASGMMFLCSDEPGDQVYKFVYDQSPDRPLP